MSDQHGRTSDDVLYDWRCRLRSSRDRGPSMLLECGHRAPLWSDDEPWEGHCRECGYLKRVVTKGE